MKKSILALLLLCCLALTPGALADTNQIEYEGGAKSQAAGQNGAQYDINISKTVDLVSEGTENFFDITLTVDTHTHDKDTRTDVVLVLDISNTMNDPIGGGATSRIAEAKNAAKEFVTHLGQRSELDSRRLGIVAFNTHAELVAPLKTINAGNVDDFTGKITAISTKYTDNNTSGRNKRNDRWTNVEAGLQMAQNLLKGSNANYKYVVLLTDGFPTTYIKSGRDSDEMDEKIVGYTPITEDVDRNKLAAQADGYFAFTLGGRHTVSGGVSYSDKGAQRARAVAQKIKEAGIDVFSVGIDIGGQTIDDYAKTNPPIVDTVGIKNGRYEIGSDKEGYQAWLRDSIAGGPNLDHLERYFDAPSATALSTNVQKILKAIEEMPILSSRVFSVDDPMGEDIEFMYFYDKNGKPVASKSDAAGASTASLKGESKANAENTASFSRADDSTITWDLLNSGFIKGMANNRDTFAYELKYRVRLRNEKAGFAFSTDRPTNDTTTLTWKLNYSGTSVQHSSGTMTFPIPEVEGYKGRLQFLKQLQTESGGDTYENANGFEFTLIHRAESCAICKGAAEGFKLGEARYKATSKATTINGKTHDGVVTFDNIPSGHEYVLRETPSVGHQPLHDHLIRVHYGQAQLYRNGKWETIDDYNDFIAYNKLATPVQLQFAAKKTMDEETKVEKDKFAFRLYTAEGAGPYGSTIDETVHNDENGSIVFSSMTFDTPGDYTFTLQEIIGEDNTVIYDGEPHTIQLKIHNHLEANDYHATITVDGKNAGEKKGAEGPHLLNLSALLGLDEKTPLFENATRPQTEVQLEAMKTLLDDRGYAIALPANKFAFVLRDSAGSVVDVAFNKADGSVDFEKLSYDQPGTYTYTIDEMNSYHYIDDESLWITDPKPQEGDPAVVPHDPDFFYDTSVWDVTVTVAPHALTNPNAFAASVEYVQRYSTLSTAAAEPPVFVNQLKQPASLTIRALKTLDGEAPEDHEFAFELIQVSSADNEPIGEPWVVKSDEHGVITFDTVHFTPSPNDAAHTPVGTYHCLLREVIPDTITEQIVYDPVEYHIDVFVEERHTHALQVVMNVYRILGEEEMLYATYHGQHVTMTVEIPDKDPVTGLPPEGEHMPLLFANLTYDIPETGDRSSLLLWTLALCGAGALLIARRKRSA